MTINNKKIAYFFFFSVCFSLFPSFLTLAKVDAVSDHGFIIENIIETDASVPQSWRALVSNVDAWWPKDHSWWRGTFSIDAAAGGCFCEKSGNASAQHMAISFVEPDKQLTMTGGLGPLQNMGVYGALNWQFTHLPDTNKTRIIMRYQVQGFAPDGFASLAPIVDSVQAQQLNALADYLKTQ